MKVGGYVCNGPLSHETKNISGNLEIFSKCTNGHTNKWVSSKVLAQKRNQSIYRNDSLLPATIIISGNNYEKFSLLCEAPCLSVVGQNTFMHFQKYCAAPVVEEEWIGMNEVVKRLLKNYEDLCLCGDGHNDSLLRIHLHGAIFQHCNWFWSRWQMRNKVILLEWIKRQWGCCWREWQPYFHLIN